MSKLRPEEREIVGAWMERDGRLVPDPAAQRIIALVNSDALSHVGVSTDGWSKLFRDPADGRYWELYYPQSEYHGAGPPALREITAEEVRQRFRDVLENGAE